MSLRESRASPSARRWKWKPVRCRHRRRALGCELEHGDETQAVGVIASSIVAGSLEDALPQKVGQAMVDIGRVPAILDGRGQAGDQSGLPIHPLQKEGAEIIGNRTPFGVGADGGAGDGGKTQLLIQPSYT